MPRADGPFEVLERVNDNAYKTDLPGDYGVSATFNVADLSPYLEDDYLSNLRSNSLSQGDDDGGPSMGSSHVLSSLTQGSRFDSKVQDMLKTWIGYLAMLPVWSDNTKPTFVNLITGVPKRIGPGSSPSL